MDERSLPSNTPFFALSCVPRMLSKLHRVPSVLINTVAKTGKRTFQSHLQCVVRHASESHVWRCAIVVPSSVDKRAAVRNRIKRLISEAMAHLVPELPERTEVVFFVKKGFVYESQQKANEQVYGLLSQAGFSTGAK